MLSQMCFISVHDIREITTNTLTNQIVHLSLAIKKSFPSDP